MVYDYLAKNVTFFASNLSYLTGYISASSSINKGLAHTPLKLGCYYLFKFTGYTNATNVVFYIPMAMLQCIAFEAMQKIDKIRYSVKPANLIVWLVCIQHSDRLWLQVDGFRVFCQLCQYFVKSQGPVCL